jgi:hypothetical protein
VKIKDWLQRLDSKTDRIGDDLAEIRVVQGRQAQSLEDHIRRTEAAEAQLAILYQELQPLKSHVAVFGALGKIVAATSGLVAVATLVLKLAGAL